MCEIIYRKTLIYIIQNAKRDSVSAVPLLVFDLLLVKVDKSFKMFKSILSFIF